ncbi:phosphonate ABC transporter, permease protein PhnE [Hansschlegelia beijingensis]|uniref:Phosphonate transport system permease protein n=1 Tax=Hansschlegelia beijingensis TaxID=1133344 RepID=A0A7W6D015_9HYPH|nr:phosphonate ABC transporter, permease protein PhnE [Hansschlegelia beijingensis]MBB3974258.1 phosphonate transport system permease protein [Hansschlegelia beijingensis]
MTDRVPVAPSLPGGQAQALLAGYDRALAARRGRSLTALGVVLGCALLSAWAAEVRPGDLAANLYRFTSYIGRITPTLTWANLFGDLAEWYWNVGLWTRLLVETLLIAYVGTLVGGAIAVCLCFTASGNLGEIAWARFAVRRVLEFLRTVPEVVFALLFVIAFGLGPMAGVIAIALHTAGALGKLFFEIVENIDMKPVEGVRSSGGSWLHAVRFAALPQVAAGFASYALLRFEINVRGASVMGFVGAGGIGQELISAIRQFYYPDVSAILLMIIATVFVIDIADERIRHRLAAVESPK